MCTNGLVACFEIERKRENFTGFSASLVENLSPSCNLSENYQRICTTCLQVRQELKTVRQQLLCNPALDLDDKVKRLRQAAFKFQYKQRQQSQ